MLIFMIIFLYNSSRSLKLPGESPIGAGDLELGIIHFNDKTWKTLNRPRHHEFSCTIFLELSFGYFLNLFFVLFIAVNEVHSERLQILRILISYQGKILIFKDLHVHL